MLKSQSNQSNFPQQLLELARKKTKKPKQNENKLLSMDQLIEWQSRLQEKEEDLTKKEEELKQFSKILQKQSKLLIQQKLEISEKMEKYTEILEEINSNKANIDVSSTISNYPIKQSKSLLNLNDRKRNQSLAQCQTRIVDLLQKIKQTSSNTSKSGIMNPFDKYSKIPQNNENYLHDILFNKPPSSKWVRSDYYSNHHLTERQNKSFNQCEQQSMQSFYYKINEELSKLKELKKMFDQQ